MIRRFPGLAWQKEANGLCCIPSVMNSIYIFNINELGILRFETHVWVKARSRKVIWLAYDKERNTVRKRTQHLLPHKVNNDKISPERQRSFSNKKDGKVDGLIRMDW